MKKNLNMLSMAAAACLLLAGCVDGTDCGSCGGRGVLAVRLDLPVRAVRAPFRGSLPFEEAVGEVQLLLFDDAGNLETYRNLGAGTEAEVTVRTGRKTVWAVVNGPDLSLVQVQGDLENRRVGLDLNTAGEGGTFVMCGSSPVTVGPSPVSVYVPVERLTSRVVLTRVTASVPPEFSPVVLEGVMLTNVVGNQNLSGTASPSLWYNRCGRSASGDGGVIDGSSRPASCPDLTWRTLGTALGDGIPYTEAHALYCYPNPVVKDAEGWTGSFTPRKTRLVAVMSLAGVRYYYPVTVDAPGRNMSCSVTMDVTGPGTADPDIPVRRGILQVTVGVEPWTAQPPYDENL